MARRADAPTPLAGIRLVLADLDGVVYAGRAALPHAVDALVAAGAGRRVAYLTNNASRTAGTVAEQLRGFGLPVDAEDVVTSPHAAIGLLAELVPTGSTVLVVGGEGLTSVVEAAGFRITRSALGDPAAVIQGFAPHVAWTDLAEAAFALRAEPGREPIPWVATNTDWTIPQERGVAPGNGTLVSAVHTAVGRLPVVAGKPEPAIFETALARFGGGPALMIGDRLDTDILGARRAGISSALVLTGIDGPKQLLAAAAESRPDFVVEDLRGLLEPYPVVEEHAGRGGAREFRSGAAVVRRSNGRVELATPRAPRIDVVRAGAAAVWSSGVAIYALDVDARLYSTP